MPSDRPIDYVSVEFYGKVHADVRTMSYLMNRTEESIQKMLDNKQSKFHRTYYKGMASVDLQIYQAILGTALGQENIKGNPSLLAQLASQWLGWTKPINAKESKDEATEKIMETLTDKQKIDLFSALTGNITEKKQDIDDGTTETEEEKTD